MFELDECRGEPDGSAELRFADALFVRLFDRGWVVGVGVLFGGDAIGRVEERRREAEADEEEEEERFMTGDGDETAGTTRASPSDCVDCSVGRK